MMRRMVGIGVIVILLLAVSVSWAHAQGWDGDRFVFNEDYVLHAGDLLDGNLAVVGGSATLEAGSAVHGDIAVLGGRLRIAGSVKGSVALFGGSAELTSSAVITGDFATFGGTVLRDPGAVIQGESFRGFPNLGAREERGITLPPDAELPQPAASGFLGRFWGWQVSTFGTALLMALLGVVAVLVAPKAVERVTNAAAEQPAFSFGLGLLTLIVGLLAGALLLIACGLGLLVWLVLVIGAALGWVAIGLWAGQRLLAAAKVRTASSLAEVALGTFLLTVISRLPLCIGFLFGLIVCSIGLGAVVSTRFGTQRAGGPRGAASSPVIGPEAAADASAALPAEEVIGPTGPEPSEQVELR